MQTKNTSKTTVKVALTAGTLLIIITTIKLVITMGLLLVITSCNPAVIITQANGTITASATSSKENQAVKLVTDKSRNICNRQNMSVNIIDLKTIHQGLNEDQQELVELARHMLPTKKMLEPFTPTDRKFKSILVFRCN